MKKGAKKRGGYSVESHEYCEGCKYNRKLKCMYRIMNQFPYEDTRPYDYPKMELRVTGKCSKREER